MKKHILSLILLLSFALPASAVDFMVGAKGGYFIWKPYFEDIGGFFDNIDSGTGVLYGPVLSVLFTPEINLSVAGLTGTQDTYWHMDFEQEGGDPTDIRAGTYFWETRRYDIDTAISYRISSLKIFLGYKYQYMDSTMIYTEIRPQPAADPDLYHDKMTLTTMSNGPALGLGYSYILGKGAFTSLNVSGLYMLGYFDVVTDFHYEYDGGTYTFNDEYNAPVKVDTAQAGINVEMSLGYVPEGTGLVFTLGGRFQWLSTKFQDLSEEEKADLGTETMHDYLYGIFVSVLYTF